MCCFYFEYYKDRPYFEYFGMNKFDVGPLVQLYNKMSKNKDGKVQVKTILKKFGIKRSLFMERAFSLLVCETYNSMTFTVLWNRHISELHDIIPHCFYQRQAP